MKRTLQMRDGSTVEVDAYDTECGGCKLAVSDGIGPRECALWQGRDTWGVRVRECIDAEAKALEVARG